MKPNSWRGLDQRSSQRTEASPLHLFREHLTWENARRLRPDLLESLAVLDPGPQTGLIQIRHLRGSIIDLGSRMQINIPLPRSLAGRERASTSHSVRVQANTKDSIVSALLDCMAASVRVAGPKEVLRSYGTNTGVWRVNLNHTSRRDVYTLSSSFRSTTDPRGFAPMAFHLGKRESPYFEPLYNAALTLLKQAIEEEEALRVIPGAHIDRQKYRAAWRACRWEIVGPTHPNGTPIRPVARKRS